MKGPASCLPRADAGDCPCLRAVPKADRSACYPRAPPAGPREGPGELRIQGIPGLTGLATHVCSDIAEFPWGPLSTHPSQLPLQAEAGGGPQTGTPNPDTSSPTIPRKTLPLLDGILFLIIISMENLFAKPGPWSLTAGDTGVKFTLFSRGQNCLFEHQRCPRVLFFFASIINPGLPQADQKM